MRIPTRTALDRGTETDLQCVTCIFVSCQVRFCITGSLSGPGASCDWAPQEPSDKLPRVRQPGLSVQGTASGHAHSTKWLGCGRAAAQVQPRSARGRKLPDRAGLRHFRHRITLPVVGRSTLDDQRHLISAFAHSGTHG